MRMRRRKAHSNENKEMEEAREESTGGAVCNRMFDVGWREPDWGKRTGLPKSADQSYRPESSRRARRYNFARLHRKGGTDYW